MRRAAPALVLALLLRASAAAADLPPPRGYVEPCTPALQQRPGTECVGCPSYFGSIDKCPALLGDLGFTKACQSRGASTWTEVWCRPVGGEPLPEAVSKEVERPTAAELAASKRVGAGWVAAILIGAALAALGLWRLRLAARRVAAAPSPRAPLTLDR